MRRRMKENIMKNLRTYLVVIIRILCVLFPDLADTIEITGQHCCAKLELKA